MVCCSHDLNYYKDTILIGGSSAKVNSINLNNLRDFLLRLSFMLFLRVYGESLLEA